jgi:hypothetical protein
MDLFLVARPNAHRVPLDLFYDYRTNPGPRIAGCGLSWAGKSFLRSPAGGA